MRNLVKGDDLRDILFNEIKEDIKKRIGDDITVKLESLAISEDFLVEFLEEKEYVDAIKKISHYGRFIGFQAECQDK